MPELLFAILHFLVYTLLISGVLLCLQSKGNRRARIYLAIFSFVTASELAYRLFVAYQTGTISTVDEVLPIYVLIMGVLEILLMYLYPLEVLSPKWLTHKRLFLLFLPWLLVGCLCVLIYPDIRYLSSFSQMIEYIGEFNVWFRLLILLLCFIPYTILLLRIPYKWQQSSVDNKWIYKYVIGGQGIGFLFSAVVLTGSLTVSCIHLLYSILFFLYVTYQELYLRLIPSSRNGEVFQLTRKAIDLLENLTEQSESTLQNPLWEKLIFLMDEKELWRNPDLTLEDLSKSLNTNRTTFSALIQQQYHFGYSEFINRRRIEAFVKEVESGNAINTQQLFYEVGFRSRSTALRNFRLYIGCTPGEYIHKVAEQKRRSDNFTAQISEE